MVSSIPIFETAKWQSLISLSSAKAEDVCSFINLRKKVAWQGKVFFVFLENGPSFTNLECVTKHIYFDSSAAISLTKHTQILDAGKYIEIKTHFAGIKK